MKSISKVMVKFTDDKDYQSDSENIQKGVLLLSGSGSEVEND